MAGLNTNEWSWLPSLGQSTPQDMPTDDASAQLLLKRRLAQADALRNAEMPQGQMVSGHYVAPSWTQGLANMYGKYKGTQEANQAMQDYSDMQQAKAQKYADLLGETDNAKFQQGLAQMPEFAPELVKARLAGMNKEETPIQLGEGGVLVNRKGEVIASNPKAEKAVVPTTRTMRVGSMDVTQQWDPKSNQWAEIARGPAWNPQSDTQKPPAGYTWNQQGGLTAIPGGPADKAINPTEAQSNANLFGTRANKANQTLNSLEGQYSPAKVQLQNFTGGVPGASYIANKLMSDKDQQAAQAQMDFVTAILRKESGASISSSEFENARRQYFPQPGDTKEVMAQKAANRKTAIEGIQAAAGPMNKPSGKVTVDY